MVYRLGTFEIDTELRDLFRNGIKLWIRPRAMEVLIILIENQGKAVTWEDLYSQVYKDWNPNSDLEYRKNLFRQNVYFLRRALGDKNQQFIRNIPRVGYALACPAVPLRQFFKWDYPREGEDDAVRKPESGQVHGG